MNIGGIRTGNYFTGYEKKQTQSSAAVKFVMPKERREDPKNDAGTKSDIVVKPDGSRVLVMTMNVGGMTATTSLEISKPTKIPNSSMEQESEKNGENEKENGENYENISKSDCTMI